VPIIEEWTAWLLVRERERELARQEQVRAVERARAAEREASRLRRKTGGARPAEQPPRRKAA